MDKASVYRILSFFSRLKKENQRSRAGLRSRASDPETSRRQSPSAILVASADRSVNGQRRVISSSDGFSRQPISQFSVTFVAVKVRLFNNKRAHGFSNAPSSTPQPAGSYKPSRRRNGSAGVLPRIFKAATACTWQRPDHYLGWQTVFCSRGCAVALSYTNSSKAIEAILMLITTGQRNMSPLVVRRK